MATQTDLFLAILALDAYNRGYKRGMVLPASSQIGDAAIALQADDLESQAASFYAVAYSWQGKTVISYRGTRFPGGPDRGDVLNGWTLSVGYKDASQPKMALDFYAAVKAQIPGGGGGQNILLTGHSLGGGLAAFVGDLFGSTADVFNNIPFGTGVAAYIHSSDLLPGVRVPLKSTNVRQFITAGEVATGLRAASGALSYSTFISAGIDDTQAKNMVGYGLGLDNTTTSQTLESNVGYSSAGRTTSENLHSQALMVLLLYANVNNKTDWASVGPSLYNALYSDRIANAVGFEQAQDLDVEWYAASAKFMAAIAYSAIDSGVMPFGNTGIQALFADANKLGSIVNNSSFSGAMIGKKVASALTEILVQHAGDLAKSANTDAAAVNGIFSSNNGHLSINLDPASWTQTFAQPNNNGSGAPTTKIVGLGDLATAVLANVSANISAYSPTALWAFGKHSGLVARLNEITTIKAATTNNTSLSGADAVNASNGKPGGALLIGLDGNGTIVGSTKGNDLIIGGAAITTGDGDSIIITSDGEESITFGAGNNRVFAGNNHINDTFNYNSKNGTNLIVGNNWGYDTFTFNGADQAAFTVVWGGAGADTFDFHANGEVNVVLRNMNGVTDSNITSLDMKKLQSYVDGNYGRSDGSYGGGIGASKPTIVILNPDSSDIIKINGIELLSPEVKSVAGGPSSQGGSFTGGYSAAYANEHGLPAPDDVAVGHANGSLVIYSAAITNIGGLLFRDNGWTTQTLQTKGNGLVSSNGVGYSYDSYAFGASQSTVLRAAVGSGRLNLMNFMPGQFGISLDAGIGMAAATETWNSVTYAVTAWSQSWFHSIASELSNLELRFPGFVPYPDYLGEYFGLQPGALGDVVSSYSFTQSIGNLIDPNVLNGPHLQALNVNDYLLPTAGGGSGGGAGVGSAGFPDVSASTFATNQSSLDFQYAGFQVSDTAANISSVIDALDSDSNALAITLTDSGTPTLLLSAAQAVDDTAALSKITNASYAIDVNDTAANVSAYFDGLNADNSIHAITLNDAGTPSLSLSVAQALGDASALAKITNANFAIAIVDTAAGVSASIDALNADTMVSSITLVDEGTPTLDLSVDQALNSTLTFAKILNATYGIHVEDTVQNVIGSAAALAADARIVEVTVVDNAANVLANAAALATVGQLTSITIADTAAEIITNAAALAGNPKVTLTVVIDTAANVLSNLGSLQGSAVIVSDTAANVSASMNDLNEAVGLLAIELTGGGTPSLTLSVNQTLGDTAALGKIANLSYTIGVSDTAAAVSANLDALADVSHLDSIVLTDAGTPTITVTATQVFQDAAVLEAIINPNVVINVSDTAANVAANFDAIVGQSKITSIILTDSGAATLSVSVAQTLNGSNTFGKIANTNYSIAITDTASNISIALDALNADSKIGAITLTGPGTPTLGLSALQAVADTTALGKITNADYKIAVYDNASGILSNSAAFAANPHFASATVVDSVANVLAQQLAISADTHISSIIISDTAAHISANIDALNGISKISAIAFTDSGVPTLNLTVAQAVSDGHVLSGIANASWKIAISDTSANVAAAIDALNALGAIASIGLTDAETSSLQLSVGQALADAAVLSKITTQNYGISVVDSAANLSAHLDELQAMSQLASISLTDVGPPILSVTVNQATGDAALLAKIAGSYALMVFDSASEILANQAALSEVPEIISLSVVDSVANILAVSESLADFASATIQVVDTAANILANSMALYGIPRISSMTVADSGENIGAHLVELASDYRISVKFTDTVTPVVTVTANAVSSAYVLDQAGVDYGISVVDTAANVSAYLDQFYNSPITSITLSDSGVPSLNLSVSQVVSNQRFLNKITNSTYAVVINDTAASVSETFDALGAVGNISSIVMVDGGIALLALSVSQALNETVLSKIDDATYEIAVSDTAANILANAAALQTNSSVSSIEVIDSVANVIADAPALGANPQITNVTVVDSAANVLAESSALATNSLVSAIEIVDTAANISANVAALNAISKLSLVTVEGSGDVTLTVAQALASANVLSVITSPIVVSDTAANIANNLTALIDNDVVASLSVRDSLTNFLTYQSTLSGSTLWVHFDRQDVPTVAITSTAVAGNVAAQTIAGTVIPGGSSTVADQIVTITDNGTVLATATVATDGTFTATVVLPNQGANWIVATVTDSNGSVGSSAPVIYTLDNIAPTLEIAELPLPGIGDAQTVSGVVTSEGPAGVVGELLTLTGNGSVLGTTTVRADGTFALSVTLPNQANNAIVASVTDSFGNTNNTYLASGSSGQIEIAAVAALGTANDLDFTGAITDQNLWFIQADDDLKIDIVGTNTSVTVNDWFSSSSNQFREITAGGLKIDSQVSQLVQAMSIYSANNPSFDPTSSGIHTIPNDAAVQTTLALAWHA